MALSTFKWCICVTDTSRLLRRIEWEWMITRLSSSNCSRFLTNVWDRWPSVCAPCLWFRSLVLNLLHKRWSTMRWRSLIHASYPCLITSSKTRCSSVETISLATIFRSSARLIPLWSLLQIKCELASSLVQISKNGENVSSIFLKCKSRSKSSKWILNLFLQLVLVEID